MSVNKTFDKMKYVLPPLLITVFFGVIFAVNSLYPFGNKTISWCDMDQQLVPLFLDFKDAVSDGGLLISFKNAGGMNFFGVFFFFLASPFTLLVLFVEKCDLINFMNVLVVIKLATASFTASLYFGKITKRFSLAVVCSLMYGLCAYGMMYYQNIMWLDMMYMFPLLMLSFDKLEEGKPSPYIAVMSLTVIMNYYIGFMAALFTVIRFGLYFWLFNGEYRKDLPLLFIRSSFVAALIASITLVPSFSQYMNSARGALGLSGVANSFLFSYIYTILPIVLSTGIIFVGAFAMVKKDKKSHFNLLLFIFMLIPIFIEPINKMWHTGNYMSFPGRYGFITVFVGLSAAVRLFSNAEHEKKTKLYAIVPASVACIGAGVFVLYMLENKMEDLSKYSSSLWGDKKSLEGILAVFFIVLACYAIVYALLHYKTISLRAATMLIAVLCVIEGVFGVYIYAVAPSSVKSDESYYSVVDLDGKVEDDVFYRMKTEAKMFCVNLVGGAGYNSISHYTSLTSEDYMFTMKKLGYSSYWMEVGSHGGTILTDALLSAKYTIMRGEVDGAIYTNGTYSICENEFFLPLALNASVVEELPDIDRAGIQQYLFENVFGSSDTLVTRYEPFNYSGVEYKFENGMHKFTPESSYPIITYEFYVSGKQTLYFDFFDEYSNSLSEHINKTFIINGERYPDKHSNGLINLGTYENENVTVHLKVLKESYGKSFGVFGIDNDVIEKAVNGASKLTFDVNGGKISGYSTGETVLFVPYDKGLSVKVNGEKVECKKTLSCFTSFDAGEGENEITVSFFPTGLKLGIGLCVLGIVLSFVLKKIKYSERVENACLRFMYMLSLAVIAGVYIMPLFIAALF